MPSEMILTEPVKMPVTIFETVRNAFEQIESLAAFFFFWAWFFSDIFIL